MPAKTETRKIFIKVDSSGSPAIEKMAKEMGLLNKNTKSLAGNMSFLTNAFTGFLGFLGVREIARMSDEMQNLSNRLKITAQEGENTEQTFTKIAELADRTNQSIGAVGEVYNRLAISLSKVNPKADQLVSLSETLINTFRVAGATAAETSNTIVQLSQAFTSGELRGQELRSVMEQNGILAKLLNKEFGKENIYKKAEAGQIRVSTVLKILAKNQREVLEQAQQLAPTFEQTLVKSMNKVSVAIGEINKQFQLSAKFAAVMGFAVDNLASLLILLSSAMVPLAVTYIPALVVGFQNLRIASIAFAASNPLLLALTAVTVIAGLVAVNFDKLTNVFKRFQANVLETAATVEEKLLPLREKMAAFLGQDKGLASQFQGTRDSIASMRKTAAEIRAALKADEEKGKGPGRDQAKDLEDLAAAMEKLGSGGKVKKIKEILGDLNKEFLKSKDLEEYNKKLVSFELYKLNREFKEGKFDVFTYNQRLTELSLEKLNRELKQGISTLGEYQEIVQRSKIGELNAKFEAGKISLIEYNKELVKISDKFRPGSALIAGTAAYLDSIGTLSDNVAKGITSTFGHLEDNLVEFVKTGEFNFKKFTESVLDDLTRIIIRAAIIRPLAEGILGGAVGAGAGAAAPAAKGMAFDSGVRKFAKGGIVDSPTSFSFGGGRRGLMGEAGTEAIIPLQRAGNGDLGVAASVTPVTVNIFNQTGADVEQRESTGPNGEKSIDVLITQKVRDGLYTGKFDSAMKQSYGVSRRGS